MQKKYLFFMAAGTNLQRYVIPSHDPVGDEIEITPEETDRYRELGGYYESLAKNIDAPCYPIIHRRPTLSNLIESGKNCNDIRGNC